MSAASKTWTFSKYQHLYRHKSGTYYARLNVGGKKTWRSLKTSVLTVAKAQLDELLKDGADRKERYPTVELNEKLTGREAIGIRERQLETDASIKPSTLHYWKQILTALKHSWPAMLDAELRKVTISQCEEWAGKARPTMSAGRFNSTVQAVRELFNIAIKRGARQTSPAAELKRAKVRNKDLSSRLPTRQKFKEWVDAIREAGGRFSQDCGDFVEFLAYTGIRIGEAKWVLWKHVDRENKTILVVGAPGPGKKNGEFRRIDLIPSAVELLERITARRKPLPNEPVLRVRESQKAMDRAGKKVGVEHITHHDLRHFFAAICIESGIDIPTTAAWLGHRDGGALAMRVYGHLRREHSRAAASRVSFAA